MSSLIESMMKRALSKTEGKANMKIWTDCFLKMYQSELKELSKINGGKNIKSIPRGSMEDISSIDLPIMPK